MSEFKIVNPYSLKTIETISFESKINCETKISELYNEFLSWKESTEKTKIKWLQTLAKNLKHNHSQLASLISSDMGKPLSESLKEVEKCIKCCEFYAEKSHEINQHLHTENGHRSPVGVVLGIMPWNFPLWQLIRFLVPAIIVGNTCAIKPAYNTYRIALALINCCPTPSIIECIMPTDPNTSTLISHPLIGGISFTGSVSVGRKIGQLAANHFKPCVLELGGSDPFLVFSDANLDAAITAAVTARFSNAGQTCISAKRFLFEESIFDEAIHLFKQKCEAFFVSKDPLDQSTTIGPMARLDLKEKVLNQIEQAKLTNNEIFYKFVTQKDHGFFVEPQIIDGRLLCPKSPLLTEEVFGPIAICDSFNTTENAIQKANNTKFGLGASIWSNCKKTVHNCITNIDCGTIAINKTVHSAFNIPFGGWKESGIGVELGIVGALSFTRFKGIQ